MDHQSPVDSHATRASVFDQLRSSDLKARELAWSEFRARYAPVIAGFARRCGASPQDIDDVIQDVISSFYTSGGEFSYYPAKGRFRGFLKTCTVRAALRRKGKNLKYQGVRLDEVPELELAVDPLWNDVWEEQLVSRALLALRESQGERLAFRAFEQYVLLDRPAEVVAKELRTSIDNVHQSKTRMTQRLRELVNKLRETDE